MENLKSLLALAQKRRSYRQFESTPVDMEIICDALRIAATAPSGADMQPWHFCVITDPDKKQQIREASEQIEQQFYEQKITPGWRHDLEKLRLSAAKPFLSEAPCLIVIFREYFRVDEFGVRHPNYYVNESAGIATGFLIQALHQAGLQTLTYTPSPIQFLTRLCQRPEGETAEMILVVGHGHPDAELPQLKKKPFEDIADFI